MANILLAHYTEIFRQLKGNILIIGNDPLLREALTDIFDLMSVPTTTSPAWPAGSALTRQPDQIGLILMDVTPPYRTNLDTADLLQAQQTYARLLLFSTASRQELEKWSGRPLPAPLLQKPFSMERLLVELVRVWRAPRPQPSLVRRRRSPATLSLYE